MNVRPNIQYGQIPANPLVVLHKRLMTPHWNGRLQNVIVCVDTVQYSCNANLRIKYISTCENVKKVACKL